MFSIPALMPNEREVTNKARQLAAKSFLVGMAGAWAVIFRLAGMAIGLVILATETYLSNVHNAT
jgi:hypothetical protein